jgi:hypothetical protein
MKRDLRKYAQQTSFRMILGGLLLAFLLGNLLELWIFGQQAAIFSLICMFAAMIPVALIALALWIIDFVAKHNGTD